MQGLQGRRKIRLNVGLVTMKTHDETLHRLRWDFWRRLQPRQRNLNRPTIHTNPFYFRKRYSNRIGIPQTQSKMTGECCVFNFLGCSMDEALD